MTETTHAISVLEEWMVYTSDRCHYRGQYRSFIIKNFNMLMWMGD